VTHCAVTLIFLAGLTTVSAYVKATDSGDDQRTSTTAITFVEVDTNDHRPVFDQAVYAGTVAENAAAGVDVLVVKATDADHGVNKELTYTIVDDGDGAIDSLPFAIGNVSGVISSTVPLDREAKNQYHFRVRVRATSGFVDMQNQAHQAIMPSLPRCALVRGSEEQCHLQLAASLSSSWRGLKDEIESKWMRSVGCRALWPNFGQTPNPQPSIVNRQPSTLNPH
jgi:hypothetical protein